MVPYLGPHVEVPEELQELLIPCLCTRGWGGWGVAFVGRRRPPCQTKHLKETSKSVPLVRSMCAICSCFSTTTHLETKEPIELPLKVSGNSGKHLPQGRDGAMKGPPQRSSCWAPPVNAHSPINTTQINVFTDVNCLFFMCSCRDDPSC